MKYDAAKPAYLAWLTSEEGKEQQILGTGLECSPENFALVDHVQSKVGYARGFIHDALGIMKCFDDAHQLDTQVAHVSAQNRALALNMPATMLSHADAQQKLDNLLAAGSAYICRGQTRIRRKFGDTSQEYKNFEATRSYEYDNNFSFRLLQNLRNYSQHENAPISIMPTTVKNNDDHSLTIGSKILLVKDELIGSSRVQKRVRNELSSIDADEIDLVPLIDEYYASFMIITKKTLADLVARCRVECEPIMNLYGEQPVEGVSMLIMLRPEKTGEKTRFMILHPPMQELAVFDFILNKLLSDSSE